MNVVEAIKQATEQNKKLKRVSWESWQDPKNIYFSWKDVLADDWHLKTDDQMHYVGLDNNGLVVKVSVGAPNDPQLKWVLMSKFVEQQKAKN